MKLATALTLAAMSMVATAGKLDRIFIRRSYTYMYRNSLEYSFFLSPRFKLSVYTYDRLMDFLLFVSFDYREMKILALDSNQVGIEARTNHI